VRRVAGIPCALSFEGGLRDNSGAIHVARRGFTSSRLFENRIGNSARIGGGCHSAALAVLPNIRVGTGKPQEVPSVTLTWSSHGRRKLPATMSCMKV
jgi:hypothetical protein